MHCCNKDGLIHYKINGYALISLRLSFDLNVFEPAAGIKILQTLLEILAVKPLARVDGKFIKQIGLIRPLCSAKLYIVDHNALMGSNSTLL